MARGARIRKEESILTPAIRENKKVKTAPSATREKKKGSYPWKLPPRVPGGARGSAPRKAPPSTRGLRMLFGALRRGSVGANATPVTLLSHLGVTISDKQKTPAELQAVPACINLQTVRVRHGCSRFLLSSERRESRPGNSRSRQRYWEEKRQENCALEQGAVSK